MRIFFIGTVEFSYQALYELIKHGYEMVGVAGREQSLLNSDFRDLAPLCKPAGIPFKYINDINHPNNIEFIRSVKPDIIYCVGWSSLLKTEVLTLAKLGVVGFHPALLPNNRGRHPIIWALALGLEETGSTFFLMDENADSGDILDQRRIPIAFEDDASSLYKKIVISGLWQLLELTEKLQKGILQPIPQTYAGNHWRKRGKADGRIDFRMHSLSIYNLVRALTKPYVGAHIETAGGDIKVWKTSIVICEETNIEPGKILEVRDSKIKIKTADGAIWLDEHNFSPLPLIGEYL